MLDSCTYGGLTKKYILMVDCRTSSWPQQNVEIFTWYNLSLYVGGGGGGGVCVCVCGVLIGAYGGYR
jgi:hypothetical protein